jgi:hypothetical protein
MCLSDRSGLDLVCNYLRIFISGNIAPCIV